MKPCPLEWNVYRCNMGNDSIETFNIFHSYKFTNGCYKLIKSRKYNKENLKEQVAKELQYCFWSKFEYEIVITPYGSKKQQAVVKDVFDQVMLNYNIFFEYLWKHKKELLDYVDELKEIHNED